MPTISSIAKNMLLVEAQSDKDFIQRLIDCERKTDTQFLQGLDIQVAIPSDFDEKERTTKHAVLKRLSMFVKSLNDGVIERLGIVIDMDSEGKKPLTYNITLIEEKLENQFLLNTQLENTQGLFFKNDDYDNQIGVWLMPNNHDDGYLETWIENCITDKDSQHFNIAENFINGLIHIKSTGITKAKIYTWLAIQEKPRNDLRQVINNQLLDTQSDNYQNFKQWLIATFAD